MNVATVVNTVYATGQGSLPESYRVQGELSDAAGQVFNPPLLISARPNSPLLIPPLPVAGTYLLKNIRLMDGATALSSPAQVEIDASNVLVSSVTTRPMTEEEIRQSGIVINPLDYKAIRADIGLVLSSGIVHLDYPILVSVSDPTRPAIILSKLGVPGPPPLPNVLPPQYHRDSPGLGDLDLEPIVLTSDAPDFDLDIPSLNISGLLIFPSRITYLNQFFVAGLLLQNNAPGGSALQLKDMTATIRFPSLAPPFSTGNPLVLRQTSPPGHDDGSPLPLLTPINPGMQGTGEFDVTSPVPGTYAVQIDYQGLLTGLPTGQPVPVHGTARGVVVVKDPTFNVVFTHPSVVHQGQAYLLRATITNTSPNGTAANSVQLTLNPDPIHDGAVLEEDLTHHYPLDAFSLKVGQSHTCEFLLRAMRSGEVTAASVSIEGSSLGAISLVTGVGEGGIPLSPDTLIFPEVVDRELPPEVATAGLDLLGLGWSLATADPATRPAGMAPLSRGEVNSRANDMTTVARYMEIGGGAAYSLQTALAELALKWQGNGGSASLSFDSLRRLTSKPPDNGISRGQAFANVLGSHLVLPQQTASDAHHAFAVAASVLAPHFSVALAPGEASPAPLFWIEDSEGRRLGEDGGAAGLLRDIPWGESYPFGNGRLLAVGKLDGSPQFTIHLEGSAPGTLTLSVVAPGGSGLAQYLFTDVPTATGSKARIVLDAQTTVPVLENDLDGDGIFENRISATLKPIQVLDFMALGALQDLMADQTGRVVAVLFSKPVDKATAEVASNYQLPPRTVIGAYLQPDGRIVEVRVQSRISPLVPNTLYISGVKAQNQVDSCSGPVPVVSSLTTPGGTVSGVVYGEDGGPLAGATIYLSEYDKDLLKVQGDGLDDPDVFHTTQVTTTDASGTFNFDYVMMTGRNFGVEAVDPISNASAKLSPIINAANQHMDVALFMRARGTVRGRILAPNPNGGPAAGVLVTATSTSTGEFGQVFTDELGLYEIKKIPVDTLSVVANAAGGLQAQAITRIDRGGDVATVNLTLADRVTGGVQGVVKIVHGPDKTPAAGAVVGLDNGSPFYSIVTSAYADSQGNFLITGVPIGDYGLVVFDPVTLVKKIRLGVHITEGVYAAGEIDLVDAEGGLGTVTGHFYYPNLDPVNQALIYIASGGGGVVSQARANTEGFFSLTNVPLGQWTVTAVDPVSRRTTTGQATISCDGQSYRLELYLPAVGQVHGIVSRVKLGGATEAVDGALVFFLGRSTRTHDGGHYEFTDVPVMGDPRPVIAHVGIAPNDDVGRVYARVAYAGDVERADVTLMGRGDLTVHVLVKGSNSPAMALVNLFTWVINPEDYSLDQTVLSRTTAPDGTVTFPNVLATNVGATAADGFDGMGGAGCVVQAGVTTELTVYLSHSGTVSGVILGPDGLTRVPHAIVTLSQQGMPDRFLSAGNQGTYSFEMVPPGFVTVSAQDPQNGRKGYASDKLATPAGGPVLNLNVRIPGAGGIQGVVLEDDGQGGAVPAANAQVLLKGIPPLTDRTATADALGQFYWDNVTEGTYSLQALDPYHPFPLAGRTSVTVERDRTAEVTVRLGDFGTVTGTLTWVHADNTVQPVANAQMTLSIGAATQQQLAYTITDSEGNFTFNYVPAGINFSVVGYDAQTGRTGNAANQHVEKNATLTLALQLSPLGTIQGPVTDQNGGVPSASVSTWIPGAGTVTTTAGSDGFYALPGLPAAHYNLTAVNPGNGAQATGDTGAQMFTHDGDVIEVPLAMPLTGSVTGNVFRSDGTTPVVGAVVTLDGSRQRGSVEGGHFEFQGVSLGSHTILASDPGSPDGGRAQVTVSATEPPVDAPIRFVGLGTVSGIVQYDSNPVMGFRIWLRVDNAYTGSDTLGPVGTDASGNFSFHQVRAGHITATVAAPAGSPDQRGGSQAGDLQPGGALALSFALSPVAAVRGSLVGLDGQPVSGAMVILTAQQPTGTWTTGTDATGNFAFPVIPLDPGTATNQVSWVVTGPFGGHTRGSGSVPQSGLYLSRLVLDTVIPAVTETMPVNGADEISKTPVLSATFNKALDPATVNSSTVGLTLASGGAGITGTVDLDITAPAHPVVTFTPTGALASQTDYLFTLAHAIGDTSGKTLPADVAVQFKTLDDVPPAVQTVSPANGAVEVPQEGVLRIFFNEDVDPTVGVVRISGGATLIEGTPVISPTDPKQILFQPPSLLATDTRYTVTISGVEDSHHNVMAAWTGTFSTIDTLPPTVSLSVSPEVVLTGLSATLTATALDNMGVARVDFFADGALLRSVSAPPYVASYVAPSTSGTVVLTATAYDYAGHLASDTKSLIVSSDSTPPTVTLTLPMGTVYTNQTVTMQASASDNVSVARVEFYAAGTLVETDSTVPYSASYTTPATAGTVAITATAYDQAGNQASDTKNLTVASDTTAPSVTVASPQAEAEFMNGSAISMTAAVTDNTSVSSVEFRLLDMQNAIVWSTVLTGAPYQASYPVSGLTANLDRQFVVHAVDGYGNETLSSPILVHLVYDHSPVVTVISPTTSTLAITGGKLHLEVTASDPDGPVQAVDFFIAVGSSNNLLHTFTAAPFSYDYSVTDAVGTSLAFTARVTGDKGETVTSPAVSLTVVADPGTTVQGIVVDAQGTCVSGATVSVDGYTPTTTTGVGGIFSLAGVPTIGGPITLHATFVQAGVTYTATKAGIVPTVGGTTQAGSLILYNLNDTSAVKGTLQLDGSAFRVARWGASYAIVATTSATISSNHVYVINLSDPSHIPPPLSTWTNTSVIHDMKVSGDYVYVGDDGLTILQVSPDGTLTQVSQIAPGAFPCCLNSSYPNVVAVSGQYVYVGMHRYVCTLDVSAPSAPKFVGGWQDTGRGSLMDLAVWRNELVGITNYADGGGTYQSLIAGVIDSTGAPVWDGNNGVDVGGVAGDSARALKRMFVDGNTLYISRGTAGVVAFDLAQAVKPWYKQKILSGGTTAGMVSAGMDLYVAAGPTPGVQWIQNLASGTPVISAQIDTPGDAIDVAMTAKALVVADGLAGLTTILLDHAVPLIDVSRIAMTPSGSLVQVDASQGAVLSSLSPLNFSLRNKKTGLTNGDLVGADGSFSSPLPASPGDEIELMVTDSASQAATVSLGQVPAGNAVKFLPVTGPSVDVERVLFSGNYLVVDGTDRVVTVDVSTPSVPLLVSTWMATGGTIHDLKVSGDHVYVGDDGLTILQVSPDGTLTQVSQIAPGAFPCCLNASYPNVVAVSGQYAYVGMHRYVCTLDVSAPSAPKFVGGWLDTGRGSLMDLAVWRNELVGITNYADGGGTYQSLIAGVIGSTGAPVWDGNNYVDVGGVAGDGARALSRVFVDGNTLYISRGTSGVVAFDLAASIKPTYKGKLAPPDLPGLSQGMWHGGNTLYAALGSGYGMGVVDTTTLSSLSLVVANPVQGAPHDVVVDGAYAYLATGGGVWVIELVTGP